jgi:hypothetical protein
LDHRRPAPLRIRCIARLGSAAVCAGETCVGVTVSLLVEAALVMLSVNMLLAMHQRR